MLLASIIKNKFLKIFGITIVAVCILLTVTTFVLLSPKSFYKGIKVYGVDIGGLSLNEAKAVLQDRINASLKDKRIVLKYNNTLWTIKPKDISLGYPLDDALEQAYKIGREGNIFNRICIVSKLRFSEKDFSLEPYFDKALLYKLLNDIKKKIDKQGKNASVTYNKGDIKVNNEIVGRQIDIDNNMKLIENHIEQDKFGIVELNVTEKKPTITFENIKYINTVLSSFSTVFNPKDVNRTENLRLSCNRINGVIIQPGEVFSMNKALGSRTVENGYKEAKIILKSEYVNGVGGGVCQITTTLYDAVLYSRLRVVERTHHSLPSSYVGPGQDATIAENYIDFKFKNDRDYPICISAELVNNKVTIRILGKAGYDDYKVKLIPEIIEEYPPEEEEILVDDSIPDNEEVIVQHPKNGYRVVLYRALYNSDGELVEREKISDDVYKPIRAQIKVNQYHEKANRDFAINEVMDYY